MMINKNNFFELERHGKKRYFCVADELDRECSSCKKLINESVGLYSYRIFKNRAEFGVYHLSCKKKITNKADYQEVGLFNFTIDRIPGSIPVLFGFKSARPTNSNITVFEAVAFPSDKVVDKTDPKNYEGSLGGASVGLLDSARLEELDSSVSDIGGFLSSVGDSGILDPEIIDDEKKQIGDGK